jgi:hypothetical protein
MGREEAAIATTIGSAKPAEHFRSTPGGFSTVFLILQSLFRAL